MAGNLDLTVNVDVNPALAALNKLDAKLQGIANDFGPAFQKMSAAAAGLSAAFVALGTATAAFADELSDVAAANDTTIASILGLGSALQTAGGNADNVGRLLQSLSNNVEAANGGNLKLVSTFEKLGVSISDLGTLSQDEIRNKLIKSLADMQDPIQRNALAMDLFGKAAVGVNWKQVAADIDSNTKKYSEYESAIKTAGDAFDKMGSIVKDLKVAFAQTFEPVFKYIANLKISVDDLIVALKGAAAVLVVMTSAAVIGGLVKLVNLMKTLSVVVSKNPLVTIAAALVSLGAGAATYLGLTKAMEESQQDVNDRIDDSGKKIEGVTNKQEGLNDVLKKQRQALEEINKELQRTFDKDLLRLGNQIKYLGLTEDQKAVQEEIAKIQERAEQARIDLRKKFDALDKDSQTRQQATYDAELSAINRNAEAAIKEKTESIRLNQELTNSLKELQNLYQTVGNTQIKTFEAIAKARISNSGIYEQIDLESKLNAITEVRAKLMAQVTKVSEMEKAAAIQAINEATTSAELLNMTYDEQIDKIKSVIDGYVQQGQISQQTADIIIKAKQDEIRATLEGNMQLRDLNQKLLADSRTFDAGWRRAFRSYADAASNAAAQGERIFSKMTQGLEDLIVKFVKTGKFEFKSFVQDMLETLLRSQLQSIFANIFNPDTGALGSIGKLFGIGGNTKGQTANNPLYVLDVSGGGGGLLGGAAAGTGAGGTSDTGSWFGGIVDSVTSAASSLWDSVSSIGSSIGDFFGGFFANGGTLGAGKWGIAGENGPELISGPASITPMGGGQNVTYNINAVDAASFKQLVASDPGFIHSVAMMGAGTVPRRR